MSEHPTTFGFAAALDGENNHPLEYTGNCLIGGNPDDLDGYWATEGEALMNFATQFAEMTRTLKGHFLFVRRPPTLAHANPFESGTGWRMIGRFSIGKLKEKQT